MELVLCPRWSAVRFHFYFYNDTGPRLEKPEGLLKQDVFEYSKPVENRQRPENVWPMPHRREPYKKNSLTGMLAVSLCEAYFFIIILNFILTPLNEIKIFEKTIFSKCKVYKLLLNLKELASLESKFFNFSLAMMTESNLSSWKSSLITSSSSRRGYFVGSALLAFRKISAYFGSLKPMFESCSSALLSMVWKPAVWRSNCLNSGFKSARPYFFKTLRNFNNFYPWKKFLT